MSAEGGESCGEGDIEGAAGKINMLAHERAAAMHMCRIKERNDKGRAETAHSTEKTTEHGTHMESFMTQWVCVDMCVWCGLTQQKGQNAERPCGGGHSHDQQFIQPFDV